MTDKDNFDRANLAERALSTYYPKSPLGELSADMKQLEGYPIADLIADLMHLAAKLQLDPASLIDRAWAHYACDIVEQAWKHSDNWNAVLQDPSNEDRALEVVSMHNIPPDLWYEIRLMLGFSDT